MVELCRSSNIDVPAVLETVKNDGFDVDEKWDLLTSVPMRFNRCIIFDSRRFHARTGAFGSTALDGRLTQNFFFDILRVMSPPSSATTGELDMSLEQWKRTVDRIMVNKCAFVRRHRAARRSFE